MPPRKKARTVALKASTPVQDEDSIVVETQEVQNVLKQPEYDPLKDPWTDEQETSLFKGIIRWKPSGVHKHFRMIALSEHLRNHGYDPKIEPHTRIPGIWQKLGILYNLEVVDERENSFDYGDAETIEKKYLEFSLPEEDFADMMWTKGMAPSNADSSPTVVNEPSEVPEPTRKRKRADTATANRARASTIDDTDDPKSSPAPSVVKPLRPPKSGKRSSSRLKGESSDRHASKDTTADDTEEKVVEGIELLEADEQDTEEIDADNGSPSPRASRSSAKVAKGGTQNRTQSSTRKSTRRK